MEPTGRRTGFAVPGSVPVSPPGSPYLCACVCAAHKGGTLLFGTNFFLTRPKKIFFLKARSASKKPGFFHGITQEFFSLLEQYSKSSLSLGAES